MTLAESIADLASRIADEFNSIRSEVGGGSSGGTYGQLPRSGAYIAPISATSASGLPGNQLRASPVHIARDVSVAAIGVEVTTASASVTARLGVFKADPMTGLPTDLIFDGLIDVTTTGFKEFAYTGDIPAGTVWLGAVTSASGVSFRNNTSPLQAPLRSTDELVSVQAGLVITTPANMVNGFPATFGTGTGTSNTPRVYLRCA